LDQNLQVLDHNRKYHFALNQYPMKIDNYRPQKGRLQSLKLNLRYLGQTLLDPRLVIQKVGLLYPLTNLQSITYPKILQKE
jgi:hypothetical protein